MSEAARSRYALDLDEIERQIREASSRPAAPGQAVEDPLAELARIVSGNPRPKQEPAVTASRPQLGALPAYPSVSPRDLNHVVAREFAGAPPANEYQPHEAGAGLEQDIERLLARQGQPATPSVNPDEFAEVMRSFERVIAEPRAAQAMAKPGEQDHLFAQEMQHQPAYPHHQEPPPVDLNRELADMMTVPQVAQPHHDIRQTDPAETDPNAVYDDYPDLAAPVPPVRSRKKSMMLVAAVVGVAAIGVGGALSFRGAGGVQANGQPPLIKAAEGPAKVAPANPGGTVVPDQNRQILERNAPKPAAMPAKVVATEEQPLDLKEAVKQAAGTDTAAQNGTGPRVILSSPIAAPAPQTTGSAGNAVEPRKVKTVVIKPPSAASDAPPATMAAPSPVPAAPVAAAPAPAPVKVAAIPPKPVETPVATTPAQPAAPVAQAPKPKPKPVAEARRPQSAQQAPANDEPAATGTAPMSIVPTGTPKRNQRLQQQAAVATPAQIDAAPAPRATSGSFVVQLSSEGSDAEARSAASRFKSRFSELGEYGSSIQQREVNGQTRYRVRFGGMSREDANSLCSSLKGKGQACIIQPN